MALRNASWRVWGLGLGLIAGLTTLALAQAQVASTGGVAQPVIVATLEYTQQEVQANSLVETLNEMGKQHWEVFQVVPVWKIGDQGSGPELTPHRYQILGRRVKSGN